jgi:hypothetical protein
VAFIVSKLSFPFASDWASKTPHVGDPEGWIATVLLCPAAAGWTGDTVPAVLVKTNPEGEPGISRNPGAPDKMLALLKTFEDPHAADAELEE